MVVKKRLINRVENELLTNVHFFEPIDKEAIPEFLDYFDILTLVWNESPLYRFGVSPNKVFDYMLASKPIVQALSSRLEPVELSGAGITVPSNDLTLFVEAISRLANMNPIELSSLGKKGYKYVNSKHTYRKLAIDFLDVCQKAKK